MGFFGRRREQFRQPPAAQDELELTNCREKSTFPASGSYAPPMSADSVGYAQPGAVGERPMVFSSRERKDIYIYEYSDRLEYYYKDGDMMTLIKTEVKR